MKTVEGSVPDGIPGLFEAALSRFGEIESDAIRSGVSERCLCGRLAMILEPMAHQMGLTAYRADVEYNRNDGGTIKGYIGRSLYDFVRITCDIVLHARGERRPDNLIAIEMKRHSHRQGAKESDRERLRAMTSPPSVHLDPRTGEQINHVHGYIRGYLVELQENGALQVEEYAEGNLIGTWTPAVAIGA